MDSELRLTNWLWRPWYAKLWWAAIPTYWLAVSEPTRPSFLDWYAHSGFAGYTHALFTPIVAFLVLGYGFLRKMMDEGKITPRKLGPRRVSEIDPDSPYAIHRRHERTWRKP